MIRTEISRRGFLRAGAVGALVGGAKGNWAQAPGPAVPAWAGKPMRWAQLTLVEDDVKHFHLGFWLDYFKRTKSDAVCINGGGCLAFYPTAIPYHHRSQWLDGRDVLGEIVAGCRKMGMVVLARTDPHATYDDAKAAHPDWIAVDAQGQPRRHWASPEMWLTCAFGPYNFEFMTSVHRELMSRYSPDGIFMNRWNGHGDCYCVNCRANFKRDKGFDLPVGKDLNDPATRAFFDWHQERLLKLLDVWNADLRVMHPDAVAIPNSGGALNGLDNVEIGKRCPILMGDRQARQGVAAPWLLGKSAKEYRATMGEKPIVAIFGVGLEERYRWKDSVTAGPEIRIWALDGLANGMRPWYSKFAATLHDERWLKVVEDIYVWAAANEADLSNRKTLARVGVVYSQQTAWFHSAKVEDHGLGWYQALIESRVGFEMVHDRMLDAESLKAYDTLILPNIACLSDAQCGQLRAFVGRGGNLIATHETSLYDENGKRRANFGLADVFGVDWAGKTDGPMLNSYLTLEHKRLPGHVIFKGLEDAPRIINGVSRVEVTPRAAFAETPVTLVPTYPDLPMEKVFSQVGTTDESCLFLRKAGGRVAYVPFDLDRTFWEVLCEDHRLLMRNILTWADARPHVVEVEGAGFMDVVGWRNGKSVTVHLVNMTNPMAMKGPYREFFPVGPFTVRVRVDGVRSARLLVGGGEVGVKKGDGWVEVTVPSVKDHEVVAFDL